MTNTNTENKTNTNSTVKKRDLILDGTIGEESARKIVEAIIDLNNFDKKEKEKYENYIAEPINLIINTYGGALYDANMLIGTIETSETPVHTYCYGKAMSAGLYIFVSGHKRFATPLATFMYHDASVGFHSTIEGLKANLEHGINLRNRYNEYILSRTKIPRKIMEDSNKLKEDLYLFADEALQYGLVDEIIPFKK